MQEFFNLLAAAATPRFPAWDSNGDFSDQFLKAYSFQYNKNFTQTFNTIGSVANSAAKYYGAVAAPLS